jgi:hypothetical protein
MTPDFEKLFPNDSMSKRDRVLATLRRRPVDRVGVLEQLSYNPRVIEAYTGRRISGFEYTLADIGLVIRKTTDLAMPPCVPQGTDRVTTPDGFVIQNDNWTRWHVSRPFDNEHGAKDWLTGKLREWKEYCRVFDAERAGEDYRRTRRGWLEHMGQTVLLDIGHTGFCEVFDAMGLEIYTFFQLEYPDLLQEYLTVRGRAERLRALAVADPAVTPVVLLAEDFATKQGPIFSPAFLRTFHYPHLRQVVEAWKEKGLFVLYHSDGNWKPAIEDLLACGVDGFYCLEANCGMDIVELKNAYPQVTWSGGVDGVDLLKRGTPQQVKDEVRRHILETRALETGGLFVASSSEINPPIPPENFRAMVEAVGE